MSEGNPPGHEAHQGLWEQMLEFREIMMNAPIGIFISTPDGRFTFANPALARMYGYETPEELIESITDIGTQVYANAADRNEFRRLIETHGEVVNYEYRLKRRHGAVYWVSTNARAIRNQQGIITHYQGFTTDISDRKQAEEALHFKHRLMQGIIESSPTSFCSLDRRFCYTSFNRAHARQMKALCNADIRIGDFFFEYRNEKTDWKRSRANILRALKGVQVVEESIFAESGDSLKHFEVTYSPMRDPDLSSNSSPKSAPDRSLETSVVGVSIFSQDITERKKAEQKLLESEEKYRSLVEQSIDMVYLHDLEGRFLDVNRAALRQTGYSRDELLRMNVFDLHRDRSLRPKVLTRWETWRPGQSATLETVHVRKDGSVFPVEITTGKVSYGGKEKILALARNISQRKRAEKALHDQLLFEKTIADISGFFMLLPPDRIGEGIDHALKLTGELFDFDRSYVFHFAENGRIMPITHEWCAPGITPQLGKALNIHAEYLPWLTRRLRSEEFVYIADVDRLPPEAGAEKRALKYQDIRSLLCIPLVAGDDLHGFLGFDAVREPKSWSKKRATLFKVVAELISNAMTRHMAEKRILHLSFHDQLTGLYNRLYLEEDMQRLNTDRQLPISVIMADLNGLKLINDTYGHAVGDDLLKAAADIISQSCRKEDVIARWGGDEFVILLPRAGEAQSQAISRRIIRMCKNAFIEDIPISMALGASVKNSIETNFVDVIKDAEDVMYKQKLAESRSIRSAVLDALLKTLAEKSFETEAHTRRMQDVALKIGRKLNLSDTELNRLSLLITLHDIGKIKTPEEMLVRPGPLTDEEWEIMKKHTETGYRIAIATEDFSHVAEEILCYHEHWNGKGYPGGLKGEEIPLLSRITTIADAWEVMTHGRPYKKPLSGNEVATEFRKCAGSQFDPYLVDVFLSVMEEEKGLYH